MVLRTADRRVGLRFLQLAGRPVESVIGVAGRPDRRRYGGKVDRHPTSPMPSGDQPGKPGPSNAGYRGKELGLPATGPGSVAGFARRLAALAIDWWSSLLIARGLLRLDSAWAFAVLAVEYIALVPTIGTTLGMRLVGIRVLGLFSGLPRWPAIVVRTALLLLVLPAVVYDRDGRGLHDRAAGTVVVRAAAGS